MVCWDDCDSKAATARSRQSSVADDEETLAAAELASLIKSYSAALSQHAVQGLVFPACYFGASFLVTNHASPLRATRGALCVMCAIGALLLIASGLNRERRATRGTAQAQVFLLLGSCVLQTLGTLWESWLSPQETCRDRGVWELVRLPGVDAIPTPASNCMRSVAWTVNLAITFNFAAAQVPLHTILPMELLRQALAALARLAAGAFENPAAAPWLAVRLLLEHGFILFVDLLFLDLHQDPELRVVLWSLLPPPGGRFRSAFAPLISAVRAARRGLLGPHETLSFAVSNAVLLSVVVYAMVGMLVTGEQPSLPESANLLLWMNWGIALCLCAHKRGGSGAVPAASLIRFHRIREQTLRLRKATAQLEDSAHGATAVLAASDAPSRTASTLSANERSVAQTAARTLADLVAGLEAGIVVIFPPAGSASVSADDGRCPLYPTIEAAGANPSAAAALAAAVTKRPSRARSVSEAPSEGRNDAFSAGDWIRGLDSSGAAPQESKEGPATGSRSLSASALSSAPQQRNATATSEEGESWWEPSEEDRAVGSDESDKEEPDNSRSVLRKSSTEGQGSSWQHLRRKRLGGRICSADTREGIGGFSDWAAAASIVHDFGFRTSTTTATSGTLSGSSGIGGEPEVEAGSVLIKSGDEPAVFISFVSSAKRILLSDEMDIVREFATVIADTVSRSRARAQEAEREAASTREALLRELQRRFLASMSHELRTPLNAVIAFSTLALEEELPQAARELVTSSLTGASLLLEIITSVLEFSKLSGSASDLTAAAAIDGIVPDASFAVGDFVAGAARAAAVKAAEKSIRIRTELAADVDGLTLVGSPLRLGQCMSLLIDNALKFSQPGADVLVRACRSFVGPITNSPASLRQSSSTSSGSDSLRRSCSVPSERSTGVSRAASTCSWAGEQEQLQEGDRPHRQQLRRRSVDGEAAAMISKKTAAEEHEGDSCACGCREEGEVLCSSSGPLLVGGADSGAADTAGGVSSSSGPSCVTEWVCFSVRDSGSGIPLREQSKLFSAFFQAPSRALAKTVGTGLGLAICKRLVDLQGYEITFTSQEGVGSEFTIWAPIQVPAAGAAAAPTASRLEGEDREFSSVTTCASSCEDDLRLPGRAGGAGRALLPPAGAMAGLTAGGGPNAPLPGASQTGGLGACYRTSAASSSGRDRMSVECLLGLRPAAVSGAEDGQTASNDGGGTSGGRAAGAGRLHRKNGSRVRGVGPERLPEAAKATSLDGHKCPAGLAAVPVQVPVSPSGQPQWSPQPRSLPTRPPLPPRAATAEVTATAAAVLAAVPEPSSPPLLRQAPLLSPANAALLSALRVNQKVMAAILKKLGVARQAVASNGVEAVAAVEAARAPGSGSSSSADYDVIFMDLQMPLCDGLEATRLIRELEAKQQRRSSSAGGDEGSLRSPAPVHIVALTAFAAAEDKAECFASGMDAYLSKPARPADIRDALLAFCHSRQQQQTAQQQEEEGQAALLLPAGGGAAA